MAQSLHIGYKGPFTNLPFGICAIYFDPKVLGQGFLHASITWLAGTAGTAQKSSVQSPQIKVNFLGLRGGPGAGGCEKWSYASIKMCDE